MTPKKRRCPLAVSILPVKNMLMENADRNVGPETMEATKGALLDRRALLSAALAVTVGGCEGPGSFANALAIGSSPTGVPFSFVDPWTNNLTGAMVDVARGIVQRMGKRPDFRITPFAALIPSLLASKIDLVAAAIVRTPERESVVAFSEPIFGYSGGLVVRRDLAGRFADLSSIRHLRVGAQVGTRYVDQLKAAGITQISTYDGLTDVLRDMEFGRIDAGFGDEPLLTYQLKVGPSRPVRQVREFQPPVREQLCLLTRKRSPILPLINREIDVMRRKDIAEIVRRWGIE